MGSRGVNGSRGVSRGSGIVGVTWGCRVTWGQRSVGVTWGQRSVGLGGSGIIGVAGSYGVRGQWGQQGIWDRWGHVGLQGQQGSGGSGIIGVTWSCRVSRGRWGCGAGGALWGQRSSSQRSPPPLGHFRVPGGGAQPLGGAVGGGAAADLLRVSPRAAPTAPQPHPGPRAPRLRAAPHRQHQGEGCPIATRCAPQGDPQGPTVPHRETHRDPL